MKDDQGTTEPILQKNGEGKVDGEDEEGGTRVSFREQGCAGVGNAEVGKNFRKEKYPHFL